MMPSMMPAADETVRLRNPWTVSGGWLWIAIAVVVWAVILRDPGVDHSLAGRVVASLVLSTMAWFGWRVMVYPAVLVGDTTVIVRNPVVEYVIPFPALTGVRVEDGLSFGVFDGRTVDSWAFSGSLLGSLTGSRSAEGARRAVDSARLNSPGSRTWLPARHYTTQLIGLPLLWVAVSVIAWGAVAMYP